MTLNMTKQKQLTTILETIKSPRLVRWNVDEFGATLWCQRPRGYADEQANDAIISDVSSQSAQLGMHFEVSGEGSDEDGNRGVSLHMNALSTAAATLGRKGGQTSTPAKSAAAQANGRKGGRKLIQAGTKTTLIKGHALNEMNGGALCHIFKRRAYRDNVIYRVTFNGLLPDSSNISKVEPARRGWETRVTD